MAASRRGNGRRRHIMVKNAISANPSPATCAVAMDGEGPLPQCVPESGTAASSRGWASCGTGRWSAPAPCRPSQSVHGEANGRCGRPRSRRRKRGMHAIRHLRRTRPHHGDRHGRAWLRCRRSWGSRPVRPAGLAAAARPGAWLPKQPAARPAGMGGRAARPGVLPKNPSQQPCSLGCGIACYVIPQKSIPAQDYHPYLGQRIDQAVAPRFVQH